MNSLFFYLEAKPSRANRTLNTGHRWQRLFRVHTEYQRGTAHLL